MYERGEGFEKDDEKALQWFLKSAQRGNCCGQWQAGCMYNEGKGTQKNRDLGKIYFQLSAEQNNSWGQV